MSRTYRLRLWLFPAVLLFSTSLYAGDFYHTSKIKHVYPLGDGRIVLRFEDQHANCPSTTDPKFHYIEVGQNGMTADGMQHIYAAALYAAAANLNVTIYFQDSSACYIKNLLVKVIE